MDWTCESTVRPDDRSFVVDPLAEGGAGRADWRARSLGEAIALLPDGGHRSIYLRAGAYALRRSLLLTSAVDGLSILACPGERVIVEGPRDAPAVILRDTRDVELSGLFFIGASPQYVMLEGARDCLVASNTFLGGGSAILLDHASGNAIRHNAVVHTAVAGIELRDRSDANLVSDNVVDGVDALETHGGGIFLHGVRDNRIAHNLIQDTAGFGIGVLNWDDATVNVANVIEYNVVRDTALTASDSGAIYILGRSGVDTEAVIAGNVIEDVGAAGRHNVGIYLDDSTNGAVVTHNLVRRIGSDAVQIHGGSNNRIENNLLDLGEGRPAAVLFQAAPADTNPSNVQTGNTVVHNIILSSNRDPKLFVWYDGGSPYVADNLYANATGPVALPAAPVTDPQPVLGDPTLARNGPQSHYEAAQAAAVAAFGFEWIDPYQAGPRPAR